MAKSFNTLRAGMHPERTVRNKTEAQRVLAEEMPLHELRKAFGLTQGEMAEIMQLGQSEVSKMERRTDMLISTLRRFVEAMDGELEIVAHMPSGDVRITQFHELTTAPPDNNEGAGHHP